MEKRERIRQFFAGKERVKVPTVLQMEATECGAASLAMILAYYGRWLPLEFLRQECGVTRDGSNADNLLKAARRQGCVAKAFAGRSEVLRKKEFPLILFWEFNHFLVLEGFEGDTVFLNDPAMGRRTVTWDEFLTSYTGVYMKITPSENFKREGEPYSIVKTVAAKLREDKWALIFLMVLGFCMIIPGLAIPVMGQIFIDDVFSLKHADWIVKLLNAMFGTMILLGIMTAMRAAVLTYWQKKLTIAGFAGGAVLSVAVVPVQCASDPDWYIHQRCRYLCVFVYAATADRPDHAHPAGCFQSLRCVDERPDDGGKYQGQWQRKRFVCQVGRLRGQGYGSHTGDETVDHESKTVAAASGGAEFSSDYDGGRFFHHGRHHDCRYLYGFQ